MKKYFYLLFIAILINACSKKEGINNKEAFAITKCDKINSSGNGFAKIKLTVENKSQLTLGCNAYVKIKKGNTIIATRTMGFSSLHSGESQIEESWFSEFDDHDEYDRADITLNWEIDSIVYSRSYSY